MKFSIVANNGSLEFDENDDIEAFTTKITAKNTYEYLGSEHARFNKNAKIIAIHVVGKNIAATPTLFLSSRVGEYPLGTFDSDIVLTPSGSPFGGVVDINYLITFDKLDGFYKPYGIKNVYQYVIDNYSNFTGQILITTYVTGRR